MNEVATKAPNPLVQLHDQMERRTSQFAAALPAHIPAERFKRILLTAVQNNPALATADRQTFFNSAMKAAQDGLLPDGREGAMVIYKTKVKEAGCEFWVDAVQWMPMIGGIRKKVRNSGEIETWDAHCVYENDAFEFELGDSPYIKHKPALSGDRGKIIAAYSVATLKSGEKSREVMSIDEIMAVWRKSSKQKDKEGNPTGPWKDHLGEMCRKTVARRHSKVLPMSTDLDDLLRRDDDLYDMEGASDKALPPSAKRPQISDFAELPQNPVMTEDPKAAKPEPAAEKVDEETGEITEVGVPEAFETGRLRWQDGFARKPIDGLTEAEAEAFLAGWDAAEAENKKGGGK
jgi:recombination protein RecT